jgi:hypothetical protein
MFVGVMSCLAGTGMFIAYFSKAYYSTVYNFENSLNFPLMVTIFLIITAAVTALGFNGKYCPLGSLLGSKNQQ